MNLLQETVDILTEHGKSFDDVRWVGVVPTGYRRDEKYQLGTWQQFFDLANFTYDNGFGGNEVSTNLIVVGNDWWLERGEYDGSEWWEFKTLPVPPTEGTVPLTNVKER